MWLECYFWVLPFLVMQLQLRRLIHNISSLTELMIVI